MVDPVSRPSLHCQFDALDPSPSSARTRTDTAALPEKEWVRRNKHIKPEGGMIRLEFLNSSFSSSNFSIRAFRAYPLIEVRQTVPCRAIRGNGISDDSTLPPSEKGPRDRPHVRLRRGDAGLRRGTNGVSANGVTANSTFFDGETFWYSS